jgi:hypothetical protein
MSLDVSALEPWDTATGVSEGIELPPLAAADSWDMFRAESENERRTGRAVASAPASATDAVSDIATPVRIRQTTPASLEERARVLRCRRARPGR